MGYSGVGKSDVSKVEGVGTISGGVYKELHVDGVCTIEGSVEAEVIRINGVCTCNGSLSTEKFDCDGVLTINGNLRAGTADINGVVTVNGNKAEADRIDCNGMLSVEGEISADIIEAEGKLNAKEIVGDRIRIKSYWKNGFPRLLFKIGEKTKLKFSSIDLIEGTTIELRGVRAQSVNGQDVRIGRDCEIDRVDAGGELFIHPSSRVGEVAK